MPLNERDYAREPLPGEKIEPELGQFLADDLEDWELVYDGNYHLEKVPHVVLGWGDLIFWLVVLLLAR